MRIATDPDLIGFSDISPTAAPCTCAHCRAVARRPPTAGRAGGHRVADRGRLHRAVRAGCVTTTVLAGAGAVGLGFGATAANAMPAPAGPGWDGSRYWFKNSGGEWRYTSHLAVYRARTGQSSGTPATPPATPADGGVESVIAFASAQLGKPYLWGGNGPSGFDCSGLVQQAYRRAGIELPRVADDQYAAVTHIEPGRLRRGDLIFWSSNDRPSGIHHVALYLGDNRYLEAPRPGSPIRVATLSRGYYPTHFGRP
ncbi:hypothetical protein KCMC57_up34110 [Kitasatospora sp. CMC57]|uniref:NlpC/P60 domain-containing protein n=1 Tax=Kitasatospora sp. CMC57 TaxID=3231513 RepID=A0AB33K6F6_9ACTN